MCDSTCSYNLDPNEYSQEYPILIELDGCVTCVNTLSDLFNKVCFPNKPEDLNLSGFKMITRVSEWKTKHISCECKM